MSLLLKMNKKHSFRNNPSCTTSSPRLLTQVKVNCVFETMNKHVMPSRSTVNSLLHTMTNYQPPFLPPRYVMNSLYYKWMTNGDQVMNTFSTYGQPRSKILNLLKTVLSLIKPNAFGSRQHSKATPKCVLLFAKHKPPS